MQKIFKISILPKMGGSPGLVVMGDDSCLKGHGFKSQHIILDEHYFASICCKNWIVCLKRLKINEKEARVGPFFKIKFRNFYGRI